jgi:hypothetical protein
VAFLVNVPLLGFALWATLRHVEESRDTESTGRFDWLGAAVATLAVGGLAFGLIRGQANAWADMAALVAMTLGIVCLIAFPFLMARRPDPLVPLELFRSRAFTAVNLATFFVYGGCTSRSSTRPSSSRASWATAPERASRAYRPGSLALLSTDRDAVRAHRARHSLLQVHS